MRVGINLPQYDIDFASGRIDAKKAVDLCRIADDNGIDAVWLSDHPWVVAPDGVRHGALDPHVLLTALACTTRRVRLGTLVLAASLREPACLATSWASLAALAPDRLTLGIGAGWYPATHRSLGIPLGSYAARMQRLEATLQLLRPTSEEDSHEDSHEDGDHHEPFEILVGGVGDEALDVAARHADLWNASWDVPPEAFGRRSADLDVACRRAERDPTTLRRSVGLTVLCAPTRRNIEDALARLRTRAPWLAGLGLSTLSEQALVGEPDECADRIARYGADEVVISPVLRDDSELAQVLCCELAPRIREITRGAS